MSNTDFESGICLCGKKKTEHLPPAFWCNENFFNLETYVDTGIAQICKEDNAVRVLRAAKSLLDSHDALNSRIKLGIPLSLTYAIEQLEEAVEASTKRD